MLNCKVSISTPLAAFRNAIACVPKHPAPLLPPHPRPEMASKERAQKFYTDNVAQPRKGKCFSLVVS